MRYISLSIALLIGACSGKTDIPTSPVFHSDNNPKALSEWGMFNVTPDRIAPTEKSFTYELNSALFSDYAHKLRTIHMPGGTKTSIGDDGDVLKFPVGTIISKTFYYPKSETDNHVLKSPQDGGALSHLSPDTHRLIETRLLVHRTDGWHALPYVWNEDQSEATLQRAGTVRNLHLVSANESIEKETTKFVYFTPDTNQCAGCHATNNTTRAVVPIGPKLRHLKNLDEFKMTDLPGSYAKNVAYTNSALELNDRARAYLDINCSHCHNEVGPADTSGLHLELKTPFGPNLGFCKSPIAAGTGTGNRKHGIVPGQPDASIFIYRLESTNPAVMMPEVGRSLSHDEGVALIGDWITAMKGDCGA